ncbi:pentapeptide repeat-containing protein [Peribacillus sp. NPDC096447]|uniref:pentapeptide repeat-containing protein n=1 Tax=Peribacillus sp. NPDC096447 TaxID=3364394 RepID=UPI0037FD305C
MPSKRICRYDDSKTPAKCDKYGYEISKLIYTNSNEQYEIKEATMYSSLKRLEKDGCIISYWGDATQGYSRHRLLDSDFRSVSVHDGKFNSCDLSRSDFSHSDLTNSTFKSSNLDNCIFENANLTGTLFKSANLKGVTFKNSIYNKTDFKSCNLSGLIFDGETFNQTIFEGSSLKKASFRMPHSSMFNSRCPI